MLKCVINVLGWTFYISHLLVLLKKYTNNNDNTAHAEAVGRAEQLMCGEESLHHSKCSLPESLILSVWVYNYFCWCQRVQTIYYQCSHGVLLLVSHRQGKSKWCRWGEQDCCSDMEVQLCGHRRQHYYSTCVVFHAMFWATLWYSLRRKYYLKLTWWMEHSGFQWSTCCQSRWFVCKGKN